MIKFEIQENVSKYLDKLDTLSTDASNTKRFLKDVGQEMHLEFIEPLMPKWNPNLMYSPLEREHQIVKTSSTLSSLELIYTGFTELEEGGEINVWSEFAEHGNPATHHLERDYAFYQETGYDPIAPVFGGHGYVAKGTAAYSTQMNYKTMAYLDRLMHLEKWEGAVFIDLYDYEDTYEG